MDKIRIGIIGAGGIAAKLHLPELAAENARCEVTIISGRRESRLRRLADEFGVRRTTHDYADVIADDQVDAIVIATPHPQHVSWGIRAIEAGKHVLMQKPLCGDMDEANAFVAAAERTGRTVLCLPYIPPPIRALRGRLQEGEIGRVSGARARTSHGGPEVYYREVREIFGETDEDLWFFDSQRAGVGALFDMGVYAVAYLVALLGTIRRVTSLMATFDKPTDLEDTAVLLLQTEKGAIATAETSWCDPARTWELSVHGTEGKIVMPGQDGHAATLFTPLAYDSDHAPVRAESLDLDDADDNAHSHFLDCIERGMQPPLSHAQAARHVTEILLAGLESGRTGCAVALSTSAESG